MVFTSKAGKILGVLAGLLVVLLAAVGWQWWKHIPMPPRWIDQQEGDGFVLSLVAGKNPNGAEVVVAGGYYRSDASGNDLRIVCFNAEDGSRFWETRENYGLPNISKTPIVKMDSAGDVLVGSESSRSGVAKLSGMDGRKVWEWMPSIEVGQRVWAAEPMPDSLGNIWVAGTRGAIGKWQRFLTRLDSVDGSMKWEITLDTIHEYTRRQPEVTPMKNGNVMVVVPPEDGERVTPWRFQYISANDGAVLWSNSLLRGYPRWLLDENHGQLVVFWSTVVSGRGIGEIISFDLATGKERWRSNYDYDDSNGGFLALTFDKNSNIVAWGRHPYEKVVTKWWRWQEEDGFWFPEQERTRHEHALRVCFSAVDGRMLKRSLIFNPDERINEVLANAAQIADVLLLREMKGRHADAIHAPQTWRAPHITNHGISWRRVPGGSAAKLRFPDHAMLTPSGRLVIAGPHAADERVWIITAW